MPTDSVKAGILSTFSSAAVTASYQPINPPNGIQQNNVCFLRIINDSNAAITISYDGINDHEYIPANKEANLGMETNSIPNSKKAIFNRFTIVYVRGTAGTGTIALAVYYV